MDKDFLKKYGDAEHCPVRNVIDRIGDKWSVLVLMVLEEANVLRFNEIWGSIQTISQKMLTVTLTQLAAISLKNKKNWIEIQFFRGKTGDISCYYHVNC